MCATSVVLGLSASIMRQLFSQYCRYSWPHLASSLYYSKISILRVIIVWATCTCRYSLSTRVAYRLIITLYINNILILLCMICLSVFILVYDQWTIRKYDWLILIIHYLHVSLRTQLCSRFQSMPNVMWLTYVNLSVELSSGPTTAVLGVGFWESDGYTFRWTATLSAYHGRRRRGGWEIY